MRIGFDVSQTGDLKAGCGYFADSVIRHLAEIDKFNEYILYPTFGDFYWDSQWSQTTCHIKQPNFQRGLRHRRFEHAQRFWATPPVDLEAQLGNPDLIHANNFFCPTTLRKARLVYTLYDLGFVDHPEWTTEANRIGCFTGVFQASVYADLIVAISKYGRQHFLDIFPHYPADRIVVMSLASRFNNPTGSPRPKTLPQLQPENFWLSVGTLEPRKNHERLLRAYARLKTKQKQVFPLVLAGSRGWLMDNFEQTIDLLGLRQEVILLGYVDETALQWLYENCFACVYPTLFEGFGLPVLEAMSLGAPVITSAVTSIPEIVEDAGILLNPLSEEDLFQALWQLCEDKQLRATLKEKSVRQAKKFNWATTAQTLLYCYEETLNRQKIYEVSSERGNLFPSRKTL